MTLIANWKWKESGNISNVKSKSLSILIFILRSHPSKESSRELDLASQLSRTLVDGFISSILREFLLHKLVNPPSSEIFINSV